jgi:hypothetical protein
MGYLAAAESSGAANNARGAGPDHFAPRVVTRHSTTTPGRRDHWASMTRLATHQRSPDRRRRSTTYLLEFIL